MSAKLLTAADLVRTNSKKVRKQNPTETRDEVRKRNKNTGNPYKSRNGQYSPGIQPPAQAKCCGKCTKVGCLLPLPFKLEVFQQYWTEMDTYDKKAAFLKSCIEITEPNTRRVQARQSRVKNVYKYHVLRLGKRLEMCKSGFLHMLQIKDKAIRTIVHKLKTGSLSVCDGRGKNPKRTIPLVTRQAVEAHIQSYPTSNSHYARMNGNPLRMYLDPSLTVSSMYNAYIEFCRANNAQHHEVEEAFYRSVFYTFKLSFGNPKQDTCDLCDKYRIRILSSPLQVSDRDAHQAQADAAYQAYKLDKARSKGDPNYVVITADLQQVIFTPRLNNNSAFYLRKLSNYNLGVHCAADDTSLMNLWSEYTAGRGSNDVASAIWNYLITKYQVLGQGAIRELVLWSDRCTGQNNNFIILTMLTCLVRLGVFTTVNHKLFVTGHSYNDCDRDFGHIEARMKVSKVHVPADIETIIASARSENPLASYWMPAEKFKDFMEVSSLYRRPVTLKVTQSLWFVYDVQFLNQILSRVDHAAGVWSRHALVLKSGQPIGNFLPNTLLRAYDDSLPLQESKVKDLEKLLPFLETEAAAFYEYLILENIGAF